MERSYRQARILECVITEYIRTSEPIGSEQLKSIIGIEASAATIRNHLKALMDEGMLVQPHTSGGRMPSITAMQDFWSSKLSNMPKTTVANLSVLEDATKEFEISASVKFFEANALKNVVIADGRFIIAEFESGEILFNGGEDLYRFLLEFIGYDILSLQAAAEQFGVIEVANKIAKFLSQKSSETKVLNPDPLLLVAQSDNLWAQNFLGKFMNGYILYQTTDGIYFENIVPFGFAAIKTTAQIEDKNAQMLFIGSISKDFSGFLDHINQHWR